MRVRLSIVMLLVVSLPLSLAMTVAVQAEERAERESVPGPYVYVADGKNGLCIIDVSDPAAPAVAGVYETSGTAFAVAAAGDHAYITDTQGGLRVIDVSDPAAPTEEGLFEMAVGPLPKLFLSVGDYVYVANGGEGLHIIDVSDPAAPTEVGFYDTPDRALDVAVVEEHAYVAAGRNGLRIVDVSDPAAPTEVGFFQTPRFGTSVAVAGDYAHVTDWGNGLLVINVSDPANPTEEGRYSRPRAANAVAVSGGFAYVADDATGLHIVDISNPAAPTEVGHYPDLGWGQPQDLAVVGDYVYVADRAEGLRIFNISDPAAPTRVSLFDTPGASSGVAVAETPAQAASSIDSVLFIGDVEASSLDYYFPMLAASGDQPIGIESQRFTAGPSSLKDQWSRASIGPKPGVVVKEIRSGKWDVVVLQQDMTRYIDRAEEFYEYAGKFNEEIKQAGGETVLYMTWQYEPSVTTEDIAAIYNRAGAELGAKVAPVALAFQRSLQERPDLDLYDEIYLPTEHGYYLMMSALYATIFDQDPGSLSYRMASAELPPEGVFFWEEEISDEDAAFLQQVAWDTVRDYRSQD